MKRTESNKVVSSNTINDIEKQIQDELHVKYVLDVVDQNDRLWCQTEIIEVKIKTFA